MSSDGPRNNPELHAAGVQRRVGKIRIVKFSLRIGRVAQLLRFAGLKRLWVSHNLDDYLGAYQKNRRYPCGSSCWR
jgi:hypothetical protein